MDQNVRLTVSPEILQRVEAQFASGRFHEDEVTGRQSQHDGFKFRAKSWESYYSALTQRSTRSGSLAKLFTRSITLSPTSGISERNLMSNLSFASK